MKRKIIHPRKKQKIFERDNFTCVECGVSGDFNCLEVDHIISVVNGGTNDEDNLQTLCYKCHMEKRWKNKKDNDSFTNLSPLDRLELIKKRLNEYKHLTYPEFRVVYTQDELFQRLRIDFLYLEELFRSISGNKKTNGGWKSRFTQERDLLIYILKENTGKNLKELELLLSEYNFPLCFQQIRKICNKFEEKEKKKDKTIEEDVKIEKK